MSIFYFLFLWLKQIKEEKKAKARSEVRRRQRQWQAESSLLPMPKGYIDLPHLIFKQHSHRFLPLILGLHLTSLISSMQAFISSAVKRPIHWLAWAESPQSFFPASLVCCLGDFFFFLSESRQICL